MKIMVSSPITSWKIDWEKVEAVRFYFLGLQNQCGWWLQPWNEKTLTPWKTLKSMTNLWSILKSTDITLLTKVYIVKAMVFPVVIYGCENWTIKKAECQRIDAFELWCWRRLLRVPRTSRRSNLSILKEINPEQSLKGLMLKLKLKLQCFGHLMFFHWKKHWCWEILKAKGEGGGRGWDD